MTVLVDVQVACDDAAIPENDAIKEWAGRAIEAAGRGGETEISIRIVDAAEIQILNRDFRQQDTATNVLSFPSGVIQGLPASVGRLLGDVVVCASVVEEESRLQGKPLSDHWGHIIVHGTLHLLGYDHETNEEAEVMENLETQILTANGVADPYAESRQET